MHGSGGAWALRSWEGRGERRAPTRGPGVAERVSVGASWWAGWVAGGVGSKWQRGDALCGARRAGAGRRELGRSGAGRAHAGWAWSCWAEWGLGPRGEAGSAREGKKINWAARRGKEKSGLRGVGLGLLLGLGFVGFSSLFISKLFYF